MFIPQVYQHPDPSTTLLPLLRPFLPYSLPLYRRIQFAHFTQSTRVLATIPPSPPQSQSVSTSTSTSTSAFATNTTNQPTVHFCAAYIDRSRRPETESWLFLPSESILHSSSHTHSSIDISSASTSTSTSTTSPSPSTTQCQSCLTHMLALLSHAAKTCPYPAITPADEADIFAAVRASKIDSSSTTTGSQQHQHKHTAAAAPAYLTSLSDPSSLKIGSLHNVAADYLATQGCAPSHLPGVGFPYRKYVFENSGPRQMLDSPSGFRFGIVSEAHLSLVRSRTAIPRTNRTLRTLSSVAVFKDTAVAAVGEVANAEIEALPVAWAFLSSDGSLASLHVEPQYRGMGIAKSVGAKLFTDGFEKFGDRLDGLAHADVALDNVESNGVCKSLGGREVWEVYWIIVDLNKVREKLEDMQ